MKQYILLIALGILWFSSACDTDYSAGTACYPNAAILCTCDDGRSGYAICDEGSFGACSCGGDRSGVDVRPIRVGQLLITPGGLEVVPNTVATFTVENIGDGNEIFTLILEESDADDREDLFLSPREGGLSNVLIAPGTTLTYDVTYVPSGGDDGGRVRVVTADDEGVIDIVVSDGTPDIDVPEQVDIGRVALGRYGQRNFPIRNLGGGPLRIASIDVQDSPEFDFCFRRTNEEVVCPDDDVDPWPLRIAPGASATVLLRYTPTDLGSDEATLVVRSNDPDEPTVEVLLTGLATETCAEILPNAVDFGDTGIGSRARRELELSNCSRNVDLEVRDVQIIGEGFDRVDSPTTTIAPGQSIRIPVVFSPDAQRRYEGAVTLVTNDASTSPMRVPLSGVGVRFNTCPEAIARAQLLGGDDEWRMGSLNATPLDTISFDASLSSDPDRPNDPQRGIARYEWTVVQRPEDSSSQLSPHEESPSTELFLDLHGRYVVELQVYDSEDLVSCDSARLIIETSTDEDIHIQLVWKTAGDDDDDDFGSDLDLHLLHPRGSWNFEPWDCHWQNPQPNWGAPGPRDDPSLDIDDTDGLGPENINFSNAEPLEYEVGVFHYSDNGFGPSNVTIRIYLDGRLAYENEDRPLRDQQFWQVAIIDTDQLEVRNMDNVFRGFP